MSRNDPYNDSDIDSELLPSQSVSYERLKVGGIFLIGVLGLGSYISLQLSLVSAPAVALPLSLFVYGIGMGGFSLLLNYYTSDTFTNSVLRKSSGVFVFYLTLLTVFVAAGTFTATAAMFFLSILSALGFIYAAFSEGDDIFQFLDSSFHQY